MAIPEGYRLLTSADVGKTFGVDLELDVYFDNEATIPLYTKNIALTNFMSLTFGTDAPPWDDYGEAVRRNGVSIDTPSTHYIYDYFEGGESFNYTPYWWNTSYTFTENTEITSFNTDGNWNTWFYVKDKSDPYSIKIKNKEGIKLLTKDKTIEYTDDVKITIDESLLGGGEAKKFNFTLTHGSDPGGNSDHEVYSVDGGPFTSRPDSYGGSVELTGNYLVLYGMYGTSKPTIYNVSVTGGTFVGAGLYASSGQYTVIFVTITEDNAEIYYATYD